MNSFAPEDVPLPALDNLEENPDLLVGEEVAPEHGLHIEDFGEEE